MLDGKTAGMPGFSAYSLQPIFEHRGIGSLRRTLGDGADEAAAIVQEAFDYVSATPTRQSRLFAKGPFGPGKALAAVTDQVDDLRTDPDSHEVSVTCAQTDDEVIGGSFNPGLATIEVVAASVVTPSTLPPAR